MLHRVLIALALACLVLFCGGLSTESKEPIARAESTKAGPFKIVSAGDSVFRFDESSGVSWVLRRRKGGEDVGWLPIPLLKQEEVTTQNAGPLPEIFPEKDDISQSMDLDEILMKKGYLRVKLNPMKMGYLSVKAEANGHDLNLIVDTGAPQTHLDRDRTERLGLVWKKRDRENGKGSTDEDVWYTMIASLNVGRFKNSNLRIGSHDVADVNSVREYYGDAPVDGVLGADVLDQGLSIIDYRTHSLYLLNRNHRRLRTISDGEGKITGAIGPQGAQ